VRCLVCLGAPDPELDREVAFATATREEGKPMERALIEIDPKHTTIKAVRTHTFGIIDRATVNFAVSAFYSSFRILMSILCKRRPFR
jgi:hypothetical protein